MKKFTFSLTFIIATHIAMAQLATRYQFDNSPPILKECTQLGKPIDSLFAPVANSIFVITNQYNADTLIATCLLWGVINNEHLKFCTTKQLVNYKSNNCATYEENSKENKLKELKNIDTAIELNDVEEYRLYFYIPKSYLEKLAKPVYPTGWYNTRFNIGAQTLPFKIRLKQFDFAKEVNIGTSFGLGIRTHAIKENVLNIVGNISISSTDLDSSIAPKLKSSESIKSLSLLTVGLGIIYQTNGVQISAMVGKDYLNRTNNDRFDWAYQKKLWIGFGVGFNIYSTTKLQKEATAQTQK